MVSRMPRRKKADIETPSEEMTSVSGITDTESVSLSRATENTESRTTTKAPLIWRQAVFLPRGIELISPDWELAFDHFEKFDADALQCSEWVLHNLDSKEQSVFLPGGPEFNKKTAAEYTEMERRRLCEEEFATYAKENLFRRPPFLAIEDAPQEWSAERMIQLSTALSTTSDLLWLPPPLLNGESSSGKDFNLKPDCAYWQSLLAFSEPYRDLVKIEAFTVDNRITCPYLTIEFKRTGLAVQQAVNQVIAASALALYNRYRLKARRLSVTKKSWTEKHFQQIRHYAITFTGPTAVIWLVRLKAPTSMDFSSVSWAGCDAMRIGQCVCSSTSAVGDLVDWVNAIHWWGIKKHGRYCADDVKAGLLSRQGRIAKRCSELFEPDKPTTVL